MTCFIASYVDIVEGIDCATQQTQQKRTPLTESERIGLPILYKRCNSCFECALCRQ